MMLQEEGGDRPVTGGSAAPLEAVLRYVARVMPSPLPLLPPGIRWLCRKKDLLYLVVEHPPQCRTLRVSRGKKGEDDYHPYRLAFPYVIYVLTFYRDGFEEMKMFFRNSALSAPTDTLYHTNLPNVRGEPGHYGSQRVCLRYRPEMLEGVPLAEAVPGPSSSSGAPASIRILPTAPSGGRWLGTRASPAWKPGRPPAGKILFSF